MEAAQPIESGFEVLVQQSGGLEAVRRLIRGAGRPYAGADRTNASRIVALMWFLSGLLTLIYLPFDPPTEAVGAVGWALAGGLIVTSTLGSRWVLRADPPPSFNVLLALSYLGLVQILFLQWLAGGTDSAYRELALVWLASAAGVHPPRRALTFLGATVVAVFLPFTYDGWTSAAVTDVAADVLLWAALGLVLLALMSYVRSERVRLHAGEVEAQELARADPLTGLGNRRAFDEALAAELARARRAGSTVSVALADIDRFKPFNDRFGHLEGDRVLSQVAAAITGAMRAGDRSFRWGGDEFAVIMPDTDYDGGELALTRIASGVSASCTGPDGHAVTLSWGVAEADADMTAVGLLDQADLALMIRKRGTLTGERSDTLAADE
jgi:diguanylate cyclase (GGDEF)-like protein